MKRPPFAALRAFDQTGRSRSLRQAAQALGITHSAISQHLKDLELWFGVPLLERTARGTSLTVAGQRLHGKIAAGFDLIDQAIDDFAVPPGQQRLSISCAPGFAAHWITPRFQSLQAALPGVEISLRPAGGPLAPLAPGTDAAISYGALDDARFETEILCTPPMVAVASPAWLAAHPGAGDLATLIRLPLIHETSHHEWQRWFTALGHPVSHNLQGPRFWTGSGTLEAARQGHGAALVPLLLAAPDLAAGTLVRVTPPQAQLDRYTLAIARERIGERAVTRFRDWLLAALARDPNAK